MNTESLTNKAFQTIHSLVAKVRERGIPSQDSPRASHCRRLAQPLVWLKDLVGRQHRCAMTGSGSKLYGVFGLELATLLDAKIAIILLIGGIYSLLWVLKLKPQKVRIKIKMKSTLLDTSEPLKFESTFSKGLRDIIVGLEKLINSESAPLPREGVNQLKKIEKLALEYLSLTLVEDEPKWLQEAQVLKAIARLVSKVTTKYKDFLDETTQNFLEIFLLFTSSEAQAAQGRYYLYKARIDNENINLRFLEKGAVLLARGLRKCPSLIDKENYFSLKQYMEIILEIIDGIEQQIQQINTSDKKLVSTFKRYNESAYLNIVSVLWLIEQFEKTMEEIKSSDGLEVFVSKLNNQNKNQKEKQLDFVEFLQNELLEEDDNTKE